MKSASRLAACAAATMLAGAWALAAIPAAYASTMAYTQEDSSAGTCAMMETATVDAFEASGYQVDSHGCMPSPGGYTLVIEYTP